MKAGNFSKSMSVMAAGAAMMLMVTGCGDVRKVPENSLAFEDVVYVEDEYPVTWELVQGDTLNLPVLGVSDFVIKDSLLIVSNNDNAGRVTVLSVDGRTVYGKFLRMGRGPGEIVSFNGVSSVQFSPQGERASYGILDGLCGKSDGMGCDGLNRERAD